MQGHLTLLAVGCCLALCAHMGASHAYAASPLDVSDELLGLKPAGGGRPQPGAGKAPVLVGPAAVGTATVAFVDVPKLMLFHPLMASYHPAARSFYRPVQGATAEERRRAADERRGRARAAEEESRFELRSITEELGTVTAKRTEARTELNAKVDALRVELDRKTTADPANRGRYLSEHSKAYSKLHDDFWKKAKALDDREAALVERRGAVEERVASSEFLPSKERAKLLFRIERELTAAIREAARRRGCSLVLNSGFLRQRPAAAAPERRTFDPAAQGSYVTPYAQYLEAAEEPAGGHASRLAEGRLASWAFDAERILQQTCDPSPLSSFLLQGGVDLSPEVADVVLAQYKVSKTKRLFLIGKYFPTLTSAGEGSGAR